MRLLSPLVRPPRAIALLVLAALVACRGEGPTGLVVELVSNLRVPDEATLLRLAIEDDRRIVLHEKEWPLANGAPVSRSVLVERGSEFSGAVVLKATASRGPGGAPAVSQQAVVPFADGRVVRVRLSLDATCVGVPCGVGATCEAGRCRDARLDPGRLADYVPGRTPAAPAREGLPPLLERFTPADGARFQASSTPLELEFSRPMDAASVEAALKLTANDEAVETDVAWSSDARRARLAPKRPYEAGAVVRWTLARTATELGGVPLPSDRSGQFTVVVRRREILRATSAFATVASDGATAQAVRLGDVEGGAPGLHERAFLTFELGALPSDAKLVSATLELTERDCEGSPYAKLGQILLAERVRADPLDRAAFDALGPKGPDERPSYFTMPAPEAGPLRTANVTAAVRLALADRAAHGDRLQVRLRFQKPFSRDEVTDRCSFHPPTPSSDSGSAVAPRLLVDYEAGEAPGQRLVLPAEPPYGTVYSRLPASDPTPIVLTSGLIVGDKGNDARSFSAAFLSFSIADVPADAVVRSAWLRVGAYACQGRPFERLGKLVAEAVSFEELAPTLLGRPALPAPPGGAAAVPLGPESPARGPKVANVSDLVRAALRDRAARNGQLQLRIRFERPTSDDDEQDRCALAPAGLSPENPPERRPPVLEIAF